jgi:Glycosyltransferase family 87
MKRARLDGKLMLMLGSLVFILLGAALENAAPAPFVDFRVLYYPARCLIQHCDPYKESEMLRIYQADVANHPSDTDKVRLTVTRYVYQPTAFSFTLPFAMLPWGPAHILWMTLTVGSLIFASVLMWNLGANDAPLVSGVLIGFLLANSELLVITGNAAGIAISLCAVAVWCFLRERFVPVGILCFAISLAVKPHDTGLVWLYFLLAGGVFRKRALQTLMVTVALGVPAVLWVWRVAPHWMQELHSNIMAYSVRGSLIDPGPASTGSHGLGLQLDLQAVISVFRDDPRIYNPVSYLVFAPLLIVWAIITLRSRSTPARTWLALAAIAALSMLPLYHRLYDSKLLLLTVPACAMLWAEGGLIGRFALLLNTAAFVLTGDLFWGIFLGILSHLHVSTTGLSGQILMAVQVFPAPLILLVMGIFYLWVYVQSCTAHATPLPQ